MISIDWSITLSIFMAFILFGIFNFICGWIAEWVVE